MTALPDSATAAPPYSTEYPLISICIANYNGATCIEQCIRSVIEQERTFDIEIIVHDDCSTDNSVSIIREKFPGVLLLGSDSNVGFCISNNRMVAEARGQYVLLLNNDAILRKGSLAALSSYAGTQTTMGILGLPQHDLQAGSLVDRGYCFDLFMNPVPMFDEGPSEVGFVTGACLWISRQLWSELGGFPPWFGSVAEDTYLCCVARLRGYSVTMLNHPGFDHWIGKNLGGGRVAKNKLESTTRRRSLSERNKTSVMIMTYPGSLLLIIFPIHMLLLGIEGLVLLASGTPWEKVKAIYFSLPKYLFRNFDLLLTGRRRVQETRRINFLEYFRKFRLVPHKLRLLIGHGIPEVR